MDPLGFSLENFDALGKWRTESDGVPIDPGPPPRLGDAATDQAYKDQAVTVIRDSSTLDPTILWSWLARARPGVWRFSNDPSSQVRQAPASG